MLPSDGRDPSQLQPKTEAASKLKMPRSTLVSRNVTIAGHRTSVRLEPDMWSGLSEICRRERSTLLEICTSVAGRKQENTSLTAAIRVFVMAYFRSAATEDGHIKAGHGGYGIGAPVNQQQMTMSRTSPTSQMMMTGSGSIRRF
jgi:predicted DNA-binding ribbon-helix-helix protein